jgi:signal transduction histidine kinase
MEQQMVATATGLATANLKPYILCVDDEKSVLDTLEFQIENAVGSGFNVVVSESGGEALEELHRLTTLGHEIAAIVSDQMMPGMNGDEFLCQAHKLVPHCKMIMLTGQAEVGNVARVINEAHLYRFISKPWDASDLKLTVSTAAESFLNEQQVREQNRVLRLLSESTDAIARSLAVGPLLRELMRIVQELSGAETVAIAVDPNNELLVEGYRTLTDEKVELNMPLAEATFLSRGALKRVQSNRQPILSGNAFTDPSLADDEFVQQNGVRSLMVFPVMNVGQLVGVFYLEHRLVSNVFTPDKASIIRHLATKAAIAIENAYLFGNLEALVNHRTERLQATLRELVAAQTQKDRIINIVSHDIRSPLSGIGELARTLQDPEVARDTESVINSSGIIQRSVSHLLGFVADILELAKLESGQFMLTPEELDAGKFIRETLAVYTPQLAAKNLTLQVHGDQPLTAVLDRRVVQQMVHNLVSNALKFTPKGGTVVVRYTRVANQDQAALKFEVADTGVGISSENIPHIFEKFTKIQRSGTKGEKGSGLGLSLVKEMVELHHGTITVHSDPGMGTTFTVLLPMG